MKNKIILLLTLFIASTVLVAVESRAKKTKPAGEVKDSRFEEVKPAIEEDAKKIVKPMKKRTRKPSEVQDELQSLRKKFEADKLLITNKYKDELRSLKKRKKEQLDELRREYRKRRASLRDK